MSDPLRMRLKRGKRIYIILLLRILGRAVPRMLQLSRPAAEEARKFPGGYRILLGLRAPGPSLVLESDGTGGLYRVPCEGPPADQEIRFTSTEAAFRLFTFRESTVSSETGGRLIAAGSLALVLSFVRIVDMVEILLLPRILAVRAVKVWKKPEHLLLKRLILYFTLLLPAPKRRNK